MVCMDGYSRLTKIFLLIKMASVRDLHISKLTVKKLTELAKERGLKGYSKKNKSELLRLLEAQENPLDQPVQILMFLC